jgi:UTP-glucose-1-phosphate uridylyltransferase
VLAAGMGSRYGGLKQLDGIGPHGETLLEYAVYDALRAGFGRVVFVVRRSFHEEFAEKVTKRFRHRIEVDFAYQEIDQVPVGFTVPGERVKPWGTGHAVLVAKRQVETPFAVINADDYYGPTAFARAAEFFGAATTPKWPVRFGMVAFSLGQTLSAYGGVSRGICELDHKGDLSRVVERTGITLTPDGPRAGDGLAPAELSIESPTSLNFFLFSPAIFGFLEDQFGQFLAEQGNDPTSEFYLPTAVGTLIKRGQATVAVEKSDDRWLGVTYANDREEVCTRLTALHHAGHYPTDLWR